MPLRIKESGMIDERFLSVNFFVTVVVCSVGHSYAFFAMPVQTGNSGAASAANLFFKTDFSSAAIFWAIDLSVFDNRVVYCSSHLFASLKNYIFGTQRG